VVKRFGAVAPERVAGSPDNDYIARLCWRRASQVRQGAPKCIDAACTHPQAAAIGGKAVCK
jgi:hypothetical protein